MSFKSLDKHFESVQKRRNLICRIEMCINDGEELNSWEDSFLEDILERVISGYQLTDNQMDKLDQIEDIVVNGREW
jgi:hypothetical protein